MTAILLAAMAILATVPDLAIHTAPNGNRYAEGLLRGNDGVGVYTYAAIPKPGVKLPVCVMRSPYIRNRDGSDNTNRVDLARLSRGVSSGFILVNQHCRGRGCSEGDFQPYVNERIDGLALLDWIRKQDFYNGQIFLQGGSYLSTVHWSYLDTNPKDVVGAALRVQTPDWYRPTFRNGMLKIGLHGGWYLQNAHAKDLTLKRDKSATFADFPLVDWSRRYYGKADPLVDEYMLHPREDDPYWTSDAPFAGAYAKCALAKSTMPVMMRTGFYDIYTEDIFDQWRAMTPERRRNCTLIVDAFDHGGKPGAWMKGTKANFPNGERKYLGKADEEFRNWCLDTTKTPSFNGFELGKVSYYALWENKWYVEPMLEDGPRRVTVRFSEATNAAEVGWTYDPRRKLPDFPGSGGICFGGMKLQPKPNFRDDVRSFVFPPIKERIDVRGRMTAELSVKSDCEDTCIYMRVSVDKGDGKWYLLRDDIKPLTYDDGAYAPGSVRVLRLRFADHAFRLEPGDRLRVDIASASRDFQPHPNVAGNPSLARNPKTAHNAILPASCILTIPAKSTLAIATIENDKLKIAFDESSGDLTVTDKRTAREWKSIERAQKLSISRVATTKDRITFVAQAKSVSAPLNGEITLCGETVRCRLNAPEDAKFGTRTADLVDWPGGFAAENGDRYLLPHGSGFSFAADETSMGERFTWRMHGYSRAWRMGLWAQYTERIASDGEILGAGGYMAVVETPCNTIGNYLKRENGRMGFSCLWENDMQTWGHERSIRFEFMTECSPMAVALRYREEMKRKGYYKTFAQKAKERPKMAENFRKISGAPSVWYWAMDGDKAGVCRYLREKCGFGDFLFQFAARKDLGVWVTPEEVKACAKAAPGVLLSEYDIYKDTMERKYLPLIDYVRPYWSLDAADNDDIVYDASGNAIRGWKVALKGESDGVGKGIGCASICEQRVADYVRKGLSAAQKAYPWYTGRYLDCWGCAQPFECYHPRHRQSRRESVERRREALAIPGNEYGWLSSTEDGPDYLASVCDYFTCGFSADNDYRVDGGRWMWKIYDGEVPDEIRRGTDEKTRMPIFEMVYHGCSVAYWDWCDYNFKFPRIWWKRDLFNALCGTPPLYFFNEETWKRFRDQLKPSYEVTTPIARATYSSPMKAYRILTPDRSVQRAEFENGVASTVNFGEREFVMKDGFVLKPRGYRFEGLPAK